MMKPDFIIVKNSIISLNEIQYIVARNDHTTRIYWKSDNSNYTDFTINIDEFKGAIDAYMSSK